ncbi:MAG TPA: ATP-dependent protease [Alphaproteobacteria bacterium]|nr:ATP-dependent protease [Alphaproteobacteria bacterium]
MPPKPLPAADLAVRIDPKTFTFETTADLPDLDEPLGQERAVTALKFGASIQQKGYNLFVTGAPGAGKHGAVKTLLEAMAREMDAPCDWAYVFDFRQPRKPRALKLESGLGAALAATMAELVDDVRTAIPAVFEGEDYRGRRQAAEAQVNAQAGAAFDALSRKAEPLGFAVINTQTGPSIMPVRDGKVMTPEEFNALPDLEAQLAHLNDLRGDLEGIVAKFPIWERLRRDAVRVLNRDLVRRAIEPLVGEARARVVHSHAAQLYLDEVQEDIVENIESFLKETADTKKDGEGRMPQTPPPENPFWRYDVNVLVSNAPNNGAPVIYEAYPTLGNLVGRLEMIAQFGTLVTNFTMIRPGALHRAYGGFLMLDAVEVLQQPMAWEALKRALRRESVQIESIERAAGMSAAISIEPAAIPMNAKIILFGDRMTYAMLRARDPDFFDLFKVQVDFSEVIARTPETMQGTAQLLGAIARRANLKPLDPSAVARSIEASIRLAGNRDKLSMMVSDLADTLREADHFARQADRDAVNAEDIERAIQAQDYRAALPKERTMEAITEGTMMIDVHGTRIGQVNGLSVLDLGNIAFGRPARISARVRAGSGKVIDIEREVALGGSLHSKGVLILSSYLASHFVPEKPLALAASLVFEQSYGGVDGDSATVAELMALLSAIAEVPLRQDIAVTGSLNQHGEVQAVGGVNEKIEGFFDLCAERGLTGTQGVALPAANVRHLMLKAPVRAAVEAGLFNVWPLVTIEDAIELLSGMPAGTRMRGRFPAGSFNRLVADRLLRWASKKSATAQPD